MNQIVERVTDFLLKRRYILLAIGVAIFAVSIVPAGRLDYDRSISKMFDSDDEYLKPFQKVERIFGGNEVIMLVYDDALLFDDSREGIERTETLGNRMKEVPGIAEVLSVARLDDLLKQFLRSDLTADQGPAPAFRDLFADLTHSRDGKTAAILCFLEPKIVSGISREKIVLETRRVLADLPDDHPHVLITGEPVMVVEGFRLVKDDGRRLRIASTALLAFTILLCFRSLRWMAIPLIIVQFTLVSTEALLVISGIELSMVSSMFAAIITVIGVATVVHVIVRYREGLRLGEERVGALRRAIRLLAGPITWACLTDAAGFTALMFASVGPIQDFGLMMAAGSVMVLIITALVLPGLALLPLPRAMRWLDGEPRRAWSESLLDQELARPLRWVSRAPYWVGGGALAITLIASGGLLLSRVESDFTRNFRRDHEIVRSYRHVENRLGGAGVWDLMLPAPEPLTWDYVQRVRRLEERLRTEVVPLEDPSAPGLTKVLSLADAIGWAMNQAEQTSPFSLDRIPGIRDRLTSETIRTLKDRMPTMISSLYAADPDSDGDWYLRIMLRSREQQTAESKNSIIAQVDRICREEFPAEADTSAPERSGLFVLMTHLIDSILRDQWKTFGVATLLIGLMMLLAFRSPTMAVVGLVPNLLPILLVLGALGWLGIRINMGTAMIAAVSIGLSIDSSIHYITSYRRARRVGSSVADSLSQVQQRVGRALCFATLALIAGFATLCFSEFVPTIYFGTLVCFAMLGGLLGNLLVLPLLLTLVDRRVSGT